MPDDGNCGGLNGTECTQTSGATSKLQDCTKKSVPTAEQIGPVEMFLRPGVVAQTSHTKSLQIRTIDSSQFPNRSQINIDLEVLLTKKGSKVTEGLNLFRSTPRGVKLYAKVRRKKVVDFVITYPVGNVTRIDLPPRDDCEWARRRLWQLIHDIAVAINSGDQEEINKVNDELIDTLDFIELCKSKGL